MAKEKSSRPWRIRYAKNKKGPNEYVRWRCYSELENARWGVLRALKAEGKLNQTLEVYNIDTGQERGQYTVTLAGIKISHDPSWKTDQ